MQEMTWTPPELLQMSGSYWGACALHAAVKLGLFTKVGAESATAAELAEKHGLDLRGLETLLDAMAAMALLSKTGSNYRQSSFSAQYLCADAPAYLGHIIMHHHHLVESWSRLDEAVLTGKPCRSRVSHDVGEVERESFLLGMFNLAMLLAPQVVAQIDLGGHQHLLDLGGGPGTYAIHFCLHNPGLRATIFDLPTTRPIAEQTIRRFNLQERVNFIAGDFQDDPITGRYDTAWLSHVLHGEGAEGCALMLEKAVAALEPGGVLLVQEFILDDGRDAPLFPALFSLNMLLNTPSGKAYSETEIRTFLENSGLSRVERLPIVLPNGAGVMCGRK